MTRQHVTLPSEGSTIFCFTAAGSGGCAADCPIASIR